MPSPTISVVIPTFNAEAFLEECLSSLLKQTFKDFEVILVNDGSTDNSLDIMTKLAKKDPRIKIIDQKNAGVSHARNIGISAAKGEYIIFMDADDYLIHNHVLKNIQSTAAKGHDVVMYNITYEGKQATYPLNTGVYETKNNLNEFLFNMIKEEHLNSPCNKLYRKDMLHKYKIRFDKNIKIGEDLLFNIEYFKHCNSVYYLNDNFYFYRTSNILSATSTYKKNKYLDLMFVNDKLARWASPRSKKLVNISKYIRIKNILSCMRDVANGHLNSMTVKKELLQYKKSNHKLIVRNCGAKLYLISLAYSYIDIRLIYMLITILYRKPKKELFIMKKINILQVSGSMDRGGTEAFLMNVLRNIDREKFNFIFLCFGNKKFDFEEEVTLLGAKIVRIADVKEVGVVRYVNSIKRVIKSENIDIVHAHTYYNSMFSMVAAKLSGVKVRITHSHFTESGQSLNPLKKIYNKAAESVISKYSTNYLACGDEAGTSLFPKNNFTVINNGIILEDFYYDAASRKNIRRSLNIPQDSVVIGHVGRFDRQKNHKFLVEIYSEYLKINQDSYLMLIGAGALENEIREQIERLGIKDNVLFLGKRSDVNKLYNAMDLFLLPSLYEGLPVTIVETQANGLKALISDNIDHSAKLTECVDFYGLGQDASSWAIKIQETNLRRTDTRAVMESSPYNIKKNILTIEKLYKDLFKRKG